MTRLISDEMLMAYADGELDAAERARIAAAVACDAELAGRLRRFEESRDVLKAAFPLSAYEQAPSAATMAAIDRLVAAGARPSESVTAFHRSATRRSREARPAWQRWSVSLAASFALAAFGFWLFQLDAARESAVRLAGAEVGIAARGTPLFTALEATPSGERYVPVERGAAGEHIAPVLSFRAKDGRYCREFEIETTEASSLGIACREVDHWRIEAAVARVGGATTDGGYQPASGEIHPTLDSALSQLGAEPPLDREAEQRAIAEGWR
jgi:anti-sigma factor RsiW